jgi:glycosyltransferase involved in cell wall biosynthesis
MRLLMTITAYPPSIGGAQLLMHQLARHLMPRHAVQVISQWDENRTDWLLGTTLRGPHQSRDYVLDGIPVHRLAIPASERLSLLPWVTLYYLAQAPALSHISDVLVKQLEPGAAQVDLIHNCRVGREGLSAASLRAARARDVPFVLTPVHHPRWGTWLHRHYHRLYRQADAVITLTTAEQQTLVDLGVAPERTFVTGMGPVLAAQADASRFRCVHQLTDDPIVLFLGQKHAYKGAAVLLAAARLIWKRHPEVRFVFIGPRTVHSQRLFAKIRDPRVLELGRVSLEAKTDALAACSLLCVPSTQESFGGVYVEAWCLGKPVVAADIPAIRCVIDDGVDGYCVTPSPAALADRIEHLLNHPGIAEQMGQRGQEKAQQRYAWRRLAELTERAYAAALTGRS